MIAVLAQEEDHPVVREFFELFKTPWEFYRADGDYSVLLCATNVIPPDSAKAIIAYGGVETSFDRANGTKVRSRHSGAMVSNGSSRIPIYGSCLVFESSMPGVVTHESTREAAAVTVARGGQTIVRVGFDLFQEVGCLLTQGQPSAAPEYRSWNCTSHCYGA